MDFIYDPYLVLYLPLYELDGASFMSKDAYGHLCTVTGALWTPHGRYFDGTDDLVNCGNHNSLNLATAVTLEAWVNASSFPATGPVLIVKRVDDTHREYELRLADSVGNLKFLDSNDNLTSDGAISTDSWEHIVAVRDITAGKVHFYINGVLDSSKNSSGSTNANVTIGDREEGTRPFGGLIGEVRIYNRILTPLEIQHNYLATKWRYR